MSDIKDAFAEVSARIGELRKLIAAKPSLRLGTVQGASGSRVDIVIDGDSAATPCLAFCAASAGDRVSVLTLGTSRVAIARRGGDGTPEPAYYTEDGWTIKKFNDGMCIAIKMSTYSTATSTAWRNIFCSAELDIPQFPQGLFIDPPFATISGSDNGAYAWPVVKGNASLSAPCESIQLGSAQNYASINANINFQAIGRWR